MSKILSTKINSIFLAAILVAGIFALMSPSFMNNAQAELKYDNKPQQLPSFKPDYNYKSKDTIGIKKVNCNNVNLNVNDVSVNNNIGRPPVGDFTSSLDTSGTEDQEITANSFANGERPNNNGFKKDKDGFVYVCINNNNNTGQSSEDGGDTDETNPCQLCIDRTLTSEQRDTINEVLSNGGITLGMSDPITSLDVLCELIISINNEGNQVNPNSLENLFNAVNENLRESDQITTEVINSLIDCLQDARLISPDF